MTVWEHLATLPATFRRVREDTRFQQVLAQLAHTGTMVGAGIGNGVGIGVHASHRWVTASLQYRLFTGRTQGECLPIGSVIGRLRRRWGNRFMRQG